MTGKPVKQAGGAEGALLSSHTLISLDRPLILSFAETEQGAVTAPLQGLSELIPLVRGKVFCRDALLEGCSRGDSLHGFTPSAQHVNLSLRA